MLLDLGVSVPLRPLGFLSSGRKSPRVVIRRPYMGTIIRICWVYLKTEVHYEELEEYNLDKQLLFYAQHGKEVAEIVAYGICRGYLSGKLFHKAVAAYLRWRIHPSVLVDLYVRFLEFINIKSFHPIISLTGRTNILRPKLSHEESGS